MKIVRHGSWLIGWSALVLACSSERVGEGAEPIEMAPTGGQTSSDAAGSGGAGASSSGGSGASSAPMPPLDSNPPMNGGTGAPDPASGAGGAGGAAASAAPPGTGGLSAPPDPLSGDPDGSGPIVSIPDAPCGPAPGLDAFVAGTGIPGPGTPNIKVGGRDVVLSYPCEKGEGAHVTFILNLHGTMPEETFKLYQHGYFSAHKLVTSHNLIVATPKSESAVGQWDNGQPSDIPHLYDVIDWVYGKLGTKFQITGLWIAGHSWGSMFAKRFVCDPMIADKVRGVIGQSGGMLAPACGDRISQIHTAGELEGGASLNPDQSAVAAAHGCDAMAPIRDIGNGQMLYDWPNCDPGWVHFNFVMGAHEHITAIDDPVVLHIVEAIKSTEIR